MRILTYNLWHGLAPAGRLTFRALEPEFRRRAREQLHLQILSQWQPDLSCLQEVNPISQRPGSLAAVLNQESFVQPDLVGMKWRGLGWPWNLNSGLLTLVNKKWTPKWLAGKKLSGAKWSYESKSIAVQWRETRYSLWVEFFHPTWGRTLAVNLHLHHGLEWDESLERVVKSWHKEGHLSESAAVELKERLESGNRRREQEVAVLLELLEKVTSRYNLVLLGGDFNFSPASATYRRVTEAGFQDLWQLGGRDENDSFTFDSERNHSNHVFTRDFPLGLETSDLSFSPKTWQLMEETLKRHEARRRRIDYLFAKSSGATLKVKTLELVGLPQGDHLAPSDHFGVLAELQ